MAQAYDWIVKILAIGDSGVGKTSLITRFSENTFQETYISTLGVDFKLRTIELDGMTIRVQLWDTAGQEKFRSITNAYYRGAQGVLLVFDLTDAKSFTNMKGWINEFQAHSSPTVCALLVGNKADMASHRQVTALQAETFAKTFGLDYLECSAKSGTGVEPVFSTLIKLIAQQQKARGVPSLRDPAGGEKSSLLRSPDAPSTQSECGC